MASEQDLIGALRKADAAGDTDGAHRIAAMIQQGRQGVDQGTIPAFAHHATNSLTYGLYDKAAPYLRSFARGESVDQARQELGASNAATDEAHPLAGIAGDIAGAIPGGALAERAAVKVLSRVAPGAVKAAQASLALQKGQTVRNIVRVGAAGAAGGATYGAASGAVQGSDNGAGGAALGAAEGAGLGAAGGAVLGAGGATATQLGAAAYDALQGPSLKAFNLVAKKVKADPRELYAHWQGLQQDTGQKVSLAAAATDLRTRGELAATASKNPAVGAAVETARQKAAAELPTFMAQKTEDALGPPRDLAQYVKERHDAADAAMNPIRGQLIGLSPDEADFFKGEVRPHVNMGPANKDLAAELDNNTISIGHLDTLRKNLAKQDFANPGKSFDVLEKNVAQIGRSFQPYADMLDEYASRSREISGFEHGLSGKTLGQTRDYTISQTPEGRQGYQAGLATRLNDQSFKNESSAAGTARDLSQNAATATNVNRTFGPQATQSLANAAAAKHQTLRNLTDISPGVPAGEPTNASAATHAAIAAVSTVKGGIYHLAQTALSRLNGRYSPEVQNKLADMLTDPTKAPRAIAWLRMKGANDHDLRVLMTRVAKASGRPAGALANYLTQQEQRQ